MDDVITVLIICLFTPIAITLKLMLEKIINYKRRLAMAKDVLPEHSCSTCKHYEKPVGVDPCLECVSKWTEEPASKWEAENDKTTL